MEKALDKINLMLSEKGLFSRWLQVEGALAETMGQLDIIPKDAAKDIVARCDIQYIDIEKYEEIYKQTGHPMVALLKLLEQAVGSASGQYIHFGATTQDIIDTATVLLLKETIKVVEIKLKNLMKITCQLAEQYAETPMIGRTHNIHAQPITFGYKAAIWAGELSRCLERIQQGKQRILVIQLSGAVGSMVSFGHKGMEIQTAMAEKLGLWVPEICWHASRDCYGEFAMVMMLVGSCLERISREIYALMGTEFQELSEMWDEEKIGSSTMPHKINPTKSQHVIASAVRLRHLSEEVIEWMPVDHERNMQHFLGERSCIEGICQVVISLLDDSEELLGTLKVFPEHMLMNMNLLGGLTQSEHIMFALSEKIGKQNAHHIVHKIAVDAFMHHKNFETMLFENKEISEIFSAQEIHQLLNPMEYIGKCPEMANHVASILREKWGI